MKETCDIVIVGAGPAGTSLAIRLATAGFHVALVEQKKFPREKLCGEFISPECLSHFEELGVMPSITKSGGTDIEKTVFYSRSGRGTTVPSEWFDAAASTALGLSRAQMDARLLERSREVGVEVFEDTTVNGLVLAGNEVIGVKTREKNGSQNEIRTKLTVDATGRTRSLVRRLERNEVKKPATHVAFKTHLTGAQVEPSTCEIYAYSGGYGGCNLVEAGLANICFIASAADAKQLGSDADRVLREVVFTNKQARKTMNEAVAVKPWLAVPIERFGRTTLVPANGLIAVGDAAAFIDPFTGSGMLLAMESSAVAAAAVAKTLSGKSDLTWLANSYRQAYAENFDSRLRICSMLRYAAFVPFWAEATITLLNISGGLRRRLALATRSNAARAA